MVACTRCRLLLPAAGVATPAARCTGSSRGQKIRVCAPDAADAVLSASSTVDAGPAVLVDCPLGPAEACAIAGAAVPFFSVSTCFACRG